MSDVATVLDELQQCVRDAGRWRELSSQLAATGNTLTADELTDRCYAVRAQRDRLLRACEMMLVLLESEYGNAVRNGYFPDVKPTLELANAAVKQVRGAE